MYSAWIKIDDSLPWIELEEAFRTKAEAQRAVKEILSKTKIIIANCRNKKSRLKLR